MRMNPFSVGSCSPPSFGYPWSRPRSASRRSQSAADPMKAWLNISKRITASTRGSQR